MEHASTIMVHTFVTVLEVGKENTVKKVHKLRYKLHISNFSLFNLNRLSWVICYENVFVFLSLPDVNECQSIDLCFNNGTCINTNGSYICNCIDGWQGQHCDLGKGNLHVTYLEAVRNLMK